jgi:hypothetical protein
MRYEKKLINIGKARGLCLPIKWIKQVEALGHQELKMVILEDAGPLTFTISPLFKKNSVKEEPKSE